MTSATLPDHNAELAYRVPDPKNDFRWQRKII